MIKGIGTDIIEIIRIKRAIRNPKFFEKIYTPYEREMFNKRNKNISYLAGIFCAKEAYVKALGTGFRGITFRDIEIRNNEMGKPYYNVNTTHKVHLTISHSKENAVATCIIES